MKLAITSTGPDLSSSFDPRFGRAKYLLVVDTPLRGFGAEDNAVAMNAAEGAGVQAAQHVIDSEAEAVITGNCGPKAFRALHAAGIKVYLAPEGTVAENLDRFDHGQFLPAPAANVDGHW
jgi:predicted Fe-Mo cluster-binding NifX family protein